MDRAIAFTNALIRQQLYGFSVTMLIYMSLIGIILFTLYTVFFRRKSDKRSGLKEWLCAVLIWIYACVIFQITIYRREPGSRSLISTDLNFGSMGGFLSEQQLVYSFLNCMLFVPWGFLVYFNRREKSGLRDITMVILTSFLTSVFIETAQLITKTGFFELTDIILNTAGGLIGGLLALLIRHISISNRKRNMTDVSE